MLLTCMIKNSGIKAGVFDKDLLIMNAQMAADRDRTADEYAVLLRSFLDLNNIDPISLDSVIIASVVRPLDQAIRQAIGKLISPAPMMVGPGIKTGLNIKTDIPSQVGADIVANAVAAISVTSGPLVILDFGTATTLTCVNASSDLCGVLIGPGVQTSLDALSGQAAELPDIALDNPGPLIGKNTLDAMASGFIYGIADMASGLIDRIKNDWGTDTLSVVATGPLADRIIPHCQTSQQILHERNLSLLGLNLIHKQNNRSRKRNS